jgi:hypothetical protein
MCSNATLLSLSISGCSIASTGSRCDLQRFTRVDALEVSPSFASTLRPLPLAPYGTCRLTAQGTSMRTWLRRSPCRRSLPGAVFGSAGSSGDASGLVTTFKIGRTNFVTNVQRVTGRRDQHRDRASLQARWSGGGRVTPLRPRVRDRHAQQCVRTDSPTTALLETGTTPHSSWKQIIPSQIRGRRWYRCRWIRQSNRPATTRPCVRLAMAQC